MGVGRLEDQVRAEHPDMASDLVVDDRVQHHAVDRQRSGMVGDQQGRAARGQVFRAPNLDPEPRLHQRPEQRQEDLGGELGIETELVDGVVPRQSGSGEGHRLVQRRPPVDAELLRQRHRGSQRIGRDLADPSPPEPTPPSGRWPQSVRARSAAPRPSVGGRLRPVWRAHPAGARIRGLLGGRTTL
jgi:hypothetical protein